MVLLWLSEDEDEEDEPPGGFMFESFGFTVFCLADVATSEIKFTKAHQVTAMHASSKLNLCYVHIHMHQQTRQIESIYKCLLGLTQQIVC